MQTTCNVSNHQRATPSYYCRDAQEQKSSSILSSQDLLAFVLFVAHRAFFNVFFCYESYDALVPVEPALSVSARNKWHFILLSRFFVRQVNRYVVWGSVVNQLSRRPQPHWRSGHTFYSTSTRKRRPYKISHIALGNARGKSGVQI